MIRAIGSAVPETDPGPVPAREICHGVGGLRKSKSHQASNEGAGSSFNLLRPTQQELEDRRWLIGELSGPNRGRKEFSKTERTDQEGSLMFFLVVGSQSLGFMRQGEGNEEPAGLDTIRGINGP